jgi:WD40 repeat protein
MVRSKHILGLIILGGVALLPPRPVEAQQLKPLTEDEILQLNSLLIKADPLLKRLEKLGVDARVDDEAIKRLKKAGVGDTVLDAIAAARHKARTQAQLAGKRKPVTIPWTRGKLLCLAFAPDGQTVALGGKGDTVELWDVGTGERRATLPGHPGDVVSLGFSRDGKTLAAGSYKQVWLWDVKTCKKRRILRGYTAEVRRVMFMEGDKILMSISPGTLKIWDVETRKAKGGINGLRTHHELLLSPDGKYLAERAAMPLYDYFKLWEVATAKIVKELGGVRFDHVAFAPDSLTLVGSFGEYVKIFDRPLLHERAGHGLHTKKISSVAISPDGRMLASGSADKTACLWNIATKKEFEPLTGHSGPVRVCFSPCGKILATASTADKFVKLWDVATGKERTELTDHTAGIVELQFSVNGQTLAARCQDGTVKLWDMTPFTAAAR